MSACTVTAGSVASIASLDVSSVLVHDGRLFYTQRDGTDLKLHFGTVATPFLEDPNSPLPISGSGENAKQIIVNPDTNKVFVFVEGVPPVIYTSSDDYNALSGSTTFSALTTTSLATTTFNYSAFGIGPDGRIFAGTVEDVEPDHHKYIAYTDVSGDPWTTFNTGIGGTSGQNIAWAGDSTAYYIYFGSGVSDNKGVSGSWHNIPNGGTRDSYPNDGASWVDPNSDAVVYVTTDLGLGVTTSNGVNLQDICDGIEAVQVNDFDMNSAKTIAWTASKSGVRQVTDYAGSSETWNNFFPLNDGSTYYCVAMDKSDVTGATAYAGNVRLYRTADAGSNWSRIFTCEDYPGTFSFWNVLKSIKVSEINPDLVLIGIGTDHVQTGEVGAIYYTHNASAGTPTWTRLNTGGKNTIVNDLLMIEESSGDATIYAACEYLSDGANSSYAVKTISYTASTQTFSYDNVMMSATGTPITNFSAAGLAVDSSGNVFAAGNKGTTHEPRVLKLVSGATSWKALATATLPSTGDVTAVTIGKDPFGNEVPYIAIGKTIYYLDGSTGTTWQTGYTYPTGTRIHVLYWDDLLVGTGTGLYAHKLLPDLISGLGSYPANGGWIEAFASDYSNANWFQVNWGAYNSANGETWPACGDVDGDGKAEIIVGLGTYPANGGWFEIFDYDAGSVTHKAWKQVNWPSYNSQNGETRPACGDMDGDGVDEIVIGLGDNGGGWMEVVDDASAGYAHLAWAQVHWPDYNIANGGTWPAVKK